MLRALLTLLFLLVVSVSAAIAQPTDTPTDNKAAAEALFGAGRELMRSQQYAEACAKFEASHALDPSVGALMNLANCYERLGKTASAWALFRETVLFARRTGSAEHERVASERAQALDGRLSYLTVIAPHGAQYTIERNGSPLSAAMLGTPIPVDPGEHELVVSAPTKLVWRTKVSVGASADRISVTVPPLQDAPVVGADKGATDVSGAPSSNASSAAQSRPHSDGSSLGVQRVLAIGAVVAAVGGIAVGGVFGAKAVSAWSDATSDCRPYPHCGPEASELSASAGRYGTVSTVAFVAGGVALAAGAALWFTAAPRADSRGALLELSPLDASFKARF